MEILVPGHSFLLDVFHPVTGEKLVDRDHLVFRCDPRINGHSVYGTTNQEVLRALLSRLRFLEKQKSHPLNKQIIEHLECALALHETRAIMRIHEKEERLIEDITTKNNGHWE